jgi:hypothetical protein
MGQKSHEKAEKKRGNGDWKQNPNRRQAAMKAKPAKKPTLMRRGG